MSKNKINIKTVIYSVHELKEDTWADLKDLFQEMELGKNEYLLKEGDRVDYCYFLNEGVVRVFYSHDGNEYNKTFFTPGTFPTPLTALISNSPSKLDFQALTNCNLIRFSYQDFMGLFSKHPDLETLYRKIIEKEWIKKEKHDIDMVMKDASANYAIFQEEYKGLENLIPQYHIASYLGITPIQLSRIRSAWAKNK